MMNPHPQKRPLFHSVPLRRQAVAQGMHVRPVTTSQPPRANPNTSASIQAHMARQHRQQWADTTSAQIEEEDEEEDDLAFFPVRRPTSVVRYADPAGRPVLQSGKRRYVFGSGKPSRRKRSRLFWIGFGMLVMLGLLVGGNALLTSYQAWGVSLPRTWQIDENVGHEQGKSHFLFENLNGHIFFEEIPEGDDYKHAVLYPVTVLFGPDAAQQQVTATFADVTHDGKLDILIHIGDQTIVFLNTGTGFKPEA